VSEADNGDEFPETQREDAVRTPTGTLVAACALSAALAVAGCGGNGDKDTASSGELFLQPVADQGPDPFTDSTATSTATPPPVTRTPQPAPTGQTAPRSVSGGTPGLYGGTPQTGSCDVQRQIDHLTADQGRAHAFAGTAGISPAAIPGYLRGLTSVVLRADTRVTNHGYRDGGATTFQSVLQAGTAVLVDDHGVPRVRCACGNPLAPPAALGGDARASGRAWSGYRPAQVIVVAPTTRVITDITIIDIVDHTWIERPTGHRGHQHDHVVPPPKTVTPTPVPTPHDSASSIPPDGHSTSPSDGSTSPHESPSDCTTPTVTVTPDATEGAPTGSHSGAPTGSRSGSPTGTPTGPPSGTPSDRPLDCPTPTVTASPPTTAPDSTLVPPGEPSAPDSTQETGRESVPDAPDLPDGGATIPDDPDTGSIFGSPTDVFDS
jgi:hypothetical protein